MVALVLEGTKDGALLGAVLCSETGPVALACGVIDGLIGGAVVYFGSKAVMNAIEGADEDAEENLSGAQTGAEVCSDCRPPPGTECGNLYDRIQQLTQELSKRRSDMLADRPVAQGGLGMYELFLKNPSAKVPDPRGIEPDLGNWEGHTQQILQKQQNMRQKLKKYRNDKCGALPSGAETQADLPPPSRPFY